MLAEGTYSNWQLHETKPRTKASSMEHGIAAILMEYLLVLIGCT